MKKKTRSKRILLVATLLLLSIFMVLPLLWMVRSSFMNNLEILEVPVKWIPEHFRVDNFREVMEGGDFWRSFLNSIIIAVVSAVGHILSSSFVAFGFSRLDFTGKKLWFSLLIATMLIPTTVLMIPQFIGWQVVGAYNSWIPLILPCFFGNAFYIFMLRQFFNSIPREYDNAAFLDGANYLTVYFKIILPMSKPVLATVGIFSFINAWNDFMGPLLYLEDPKLKTISLSLQNYIGQHTNQWNLMMMYALMAIIPIIILYFFTQKFFTSGSNFSGIKA